MANYPEWLLKYKSKGIYAKKVKEGYALYRGHSERVEGKNYPVFRCDEYLGIVTEEKGLITPTPSVRPGVEVLRLGLYAVSWPICQKLLRYYRQQKMAAELMFVHALLRVEWLDTPDGYRGSWLSRAFPDIDIERPLEKNEASIVERMTKQIRAKIRSKFGEENGNRIIAQALNVYAVHVNGQWVVSRLPEELETLLREKWMKIEIDNI